MLSAQVSKVVQDKWKLRCHRLVDLCVAADMTDMLSKALKAWSVGDTVCVLKCWPADRVAAVLDGWTGERIMDVFGYLRGDMVAQVCALWDFDQLCNVLPRFKDFDLIRKVLADVYFATADPAITSKECCLLLCRFPECHRKVNVMVHLRIHVVACSVYVMAIGFCWG